jgi:hypothetical protein
MEISGKLRLKKYFNSCDWKKVEDMTGFTNLIKQI